MSSATPRTPAVATVLPRGLWFLAALLIVARCLQPTEGAVFGETLWQAVLWLMLLSALLFFHAKESFSTKESVQAPTAAAVTIGWADVCLWVIALGHLVSTSGVFLRGGDRRAAVTMVCEWLGLAATLLVVRQLSRQVAPIRFLQIAVIAIALNGGLAVWQASVSIPAMAAQYAALTQREQDLEQALAAGTAGEAERRELEAVETELRNFGRPADARTRRRFEDRLRSSSEPMGLFALTNTLAGFLLIGIPFAFVFMMTGGSQRLRSVAWGLIGLLLCYVLVLTKSRTAWVGFCAGLAVAGAVTVVLRRHHGQSLQFSGRFLRWTFVTGGLVILLLAASVTQFARLDREVWAEAPKSLLYRLEYWTGALAVLREFPLFGTGPGNFRPSYLQHRVPGASEAIASPHNWLLDLWVAGGVISLLAFCAWTAVFAIRSWAQDDPVIESADLRSRLKWGGLAAFPCVAGYGFLAGNAWDLRLLPMAIGFGLLAWPLESVSPLSPRTVAAVTVAKLAAMAAVLVHLLGADGIEFPAIVQMIILLAALNPEWEAVRLRSTKRIGIAAVLVGLIAAGVLLFGAVPRVNSAALLMRAEYALQQGDRSADQLLEQSAQADPWAIEPLRLRAELATSIAAGTEERGRFAEAVRRWEELLAADPFTAAFHERFAELLVLQGERFDNRSPLRRAGEEMRRAVELSPTDVFLRAAAARLFDRLGHLDDRGVQAAAALRLDEINRRRGHADLYLDEPTRGQLEAWSRLGRSADE